MSSGGWLRRCSTRTARLSSETREPRKGRRSRRSWRTCSCTSRSICGWPGSSRAARSSATPTMPSCTARAGGRRNTCWPGSPRGWRRWGYGFTPTRRGSSTARTATVGGSTSTPPLPSSGSPSGHGGRSTARTGEHFTSFLPAISPEALKAKSDRLRELRIHRHTDLSLDDLARWLNPIIAGWMNYYGRYYRSVMYPLLRRVSIYLRRWAGKKYKRLRTYQAVQAVVDRAARTRARPVRPMASGSARTERLVRRAR